MRTPAPMRSLRRRGVYAAVAGAVIILADIAGYAILLEQQGGPVDSRTFFVAGVMGAAAACALAGVARRRTALGTWLLAFSAALALGMGVLGIFSIGFPLVVASALIAFSLLDAPPGTVSRRAFTAIPVAVAVLAAGILAT